MRNELLVKQREIAEMLLPQEATEDAIRIIFRSPGSSLRLTSSGFFLYGDRHKFTEIRYKPPFKSKHFFILNKHLNEPYFIGRRKIMVFDEASAALLILADGDVDFLGEK